MSFSDGELLSVSGEDWNSYMASNSETALGYTFYSPLANPFPDYYFTDNPTNSVWSSTFTGIATPGTGNVNNQSVQSLQTAYIRHMLSDTTGIDYRVSFSDVSNLHFQEQNYPSVGEIFIANTNVSNSTALGATARPTSANGFSTFGGDVLLDNDGSGSGSHIDIMQSQLDVGEAGATAILHELAHAIGLRHFSDTAYSGDDDNLKYTIMVEDLDPAGDYTHPDMDSSVYPTGLQLYDIVAVQKLYGVNWGGPRGHSGSAENTVYSKETAFATDNTHDAFIYTIWDGGGKDVIDASDYTTAVEIDLRQGHFSSIGVQGDSGNTAVPFDTAATESTPEYDAGNVAIAYHAIIENAIGTDENDTLIGNEWNNVLFGGGGNDLISGDGILYDGDAGYHDANTIADGTSTVYQWGPDNVAPANNHSGDDVLIGGADDDHLFGGLGTDILHGGYVQEDIEGVRSGWDSASQFPSSSEDIAYGDDGNDTADYSQLNADANASFAGGDMSIWYETYDDGAATVTKKLASDGSSQGFDILFSMENVIGTSHDDVFIVHDTMSSTLPLVLNGGVGNDSYLVDAATASGIVQVTDTGGSLDLAGFEYISNMSSYYVHGHTTTSGGVNYLDLDVSLTSTGDPYLTLRVDADAITNGTGVEGFYFDGGYLASDVLTYFSTHTGTMTLAAAVSDLYHSGGSGGAGGGGGTIPTYDGNGDVTSQRVESSIGGSAISSSIASVVDHPFIVTSFSETGGGGSYSASATFETYEQAFNFVPDIAKSDVRLTASGSQGSAALTIHVDSESYSLTISDFETGHTINGTAVYDQDLHSAIQGGSTASLSSSATNIYNGSYVTPTGLGIDPNGNVSVTYYLEQLNFFLGGSIDLTAPITFTGASSGETLTGLNSRADTIFGMGGNDYIYSYGGNDTIIGGSGNDQMQGGLGNDTYTFASGWGSDTITEDTSAGTDTIHFTGINPSDIRMYTEIYSGNLHLVDTATGDEITVNAGITGSNSYESTIGQYVEQITFDDRNNTVWSLTGGLTLTGSSSSDTLCGTAYADTIYGLGGGDYIYANAGNDTIVGGAGNDQLQGASGNDTYTFASGWGTDTVYEDTGTGTDTIHFTGIDPSDIRMYTDAYTGTLHLVQISNSANDISVYAGITGSNSYESTVGQYVEHVTFDDTNNTVWSLTSGLALTGTSSAEYLYGTAYGDTMDGQGGGDTLYGNAGNDTLYGGGGSDTLYGNSGADTFLFKAATALGASVTIGDFSTGAGDKIDISDVISGYDPLTDAITDWVQITTSGSDSLLQVDTDGTGSGHTWQQIATISGVTGLTDEAALVASGNLVVHA